MQENQRMHVNGYSRFAGLEVKWNNWPFVSTFTFVATYLYQQM